MAIKDLVVILCDVDREHKVIRYSTCDGGYTYCTKCSKFLDFKNWKGEKSYDE